jgi:hypothetical protein
MEGKPAAIFRADVKDDRGLMGEDDAATCHSGMVAVWQRCIVASPSTPALHIRVGAHAGAGSGHGKNQKPATSNQEPEGRNTGHHHPHPDSEAEVSGMAERAGGDAGDPLTAAPGAAPRCTPPPAAGHQRYDAACSYGSVNATT